MVPVSSTKTQFRSPLSHSISHCVQKQIRRWVVGRWGMMAEFRAAVACCNYWWPGGGVIRSSSWWLAWRDGNAFMGDKLCGEKQVHAWITWEVREQGHANVEMASGKKYMRWRSLHVYGVLLRKVHGKFETVEGNDGMKSGKLMTHQ